MNFRPSKHDRAIFGKLANEYNLTYYGTVIPGDTNDYIPIRGITASPEQVDDNYTAGVVSGYVVQLLQRSHDVYMRGNKRVNYTWTICAADLLRAKLPRLIIGGKNKLAGDESVLASYLRMYEISLDSLGCPIAPDFAEKFAVYVSPQDIAKVRDIFTPEFQAMMALHLSDMDFELDNRKLCSYSSHFPAQLVDLDKQLRALIWFARHLDNTIHRN